MSTTTATVAPWHTLYLVNVESGEVVSTSDRSTAGDAAREAVLDLRAHGGMAGWFGPFALSEEAERYAGRLSPEEADDASGAGLDADAIDWTAESL